MRTTVSLQPTGKRIVTCRASSSSEAPLAASYQALSACTLGHFSLTRVTRYCLVTLATRTWLSVCPGQVSLTQQLPGGHLLPQVALTSFQAIFYMGLDPCLRVHAYSLDFKSRIKNLFLDNTKSPTSSINLKFYFNLIWFVFCREWRD